MEEERKDFNFLFLMKSMDSYIFTSELNHTKRLSCETITRDVNKIIGSVSKSLPNQPNIIILLVIIFELVIFLNYGKTLSWS